MTRRRLCLAHAPQTTPRETAMTFHFAFCSSRVRHVTAELPFFPPIPLLFLCTRQLFVARRAAAKQSNTCYQRVLQFSFLLDLRFSFVLLVLSFTSVCHPYSAPFHSFPSSVQVLLNIGPPRARRTAAHLCDGWPPSTKVHHSYRLTSVCL